MRRILACLSLVLTLSPLYGGSRDVRSDSVEGKGVGTVNENFRALDQQKLDSRPNDVIPRANEKYDLGAETYRWDYIYGDLVGMQPMIIVKDVKAAGTNGGTFTSGADRTRTLNTVTTNTITGASLSSNQITLPAGTYRATFSAPALLVDPHQAKLVSVSGASVSIIGMSADATAGATGWSTSEGVGVFTVPASSTTVLELRHRCTTTRATDGLGNACNLGNSEVYSVVEIWRIK